jgi:polysaccharide deacetylase family protein (PEP-CTERM system associated)
VSVTPPNGAPDGRPPHHFTVDVEEYFQVSAFERFVPRTSWAERPSRLHDPLMRLLEILAAHGARATFFFLGWVADRHPTLVRRVVTAGHEIASHGWDHRRVTAQTPAEFRESVRRTKRLLEDLAGAPVVGFRAPSFSIVAGVEWALDALLEEGYRYDSSLFPIWRRGYGYRGGKIDPYWLERSAGRLAEVPPAILNRLGMNLPAGGGAYFRLLPYAVVRAALRDCERRRAAGTFYLHPWELDPDQPRLRVPWLTRLRHYGGLRHVWERIRRLLAEFRFRPIAETVAAL